MPSHFQKGVLGLAHISISNGNIKMGKIPSVSLPSILTCRKCDCQKKCYAAKIERLRPSVRKAYGTNLSILKEDPDTYWREVEAAIMMSRFFRFHVGGDIPDMSYLIRMVGVAARQPHCQILCFTKKFELVNQLLDTGAVLSPNLHLIFSGWTGLQMENPHHLPEAHVRFKDGTTTTRPDAIPCSGNCATCACTDGGCWNLKSGQQVVFQEH